MLTFLRRIFSNLSGKIFFPAAFVFCLILALFLGAGCSRVRGGPGDEVEQERVFAVIAAEAVQEEVGQRLELTGDLLPLRQVVVVPPLPGRVAQIKVAEGDRVKEGQLLILLENTQQELQLKQAEIAVSAVRVEVEKLETLVKQGAASEQMLRSARAELEQSEVMLELASYSFDATLLKSPLAGVVSYIWAREGQLIGSSEAIQIMDLEKVLVRSVVDETHLAYLAEEMQVLVEVPAAGGIPRTGRVKTIGQGAVPGSHSFPVTVELDNPTGDLKPGMFARIIVEKENRNALMVPGSALREEGGQAYLFVLAGSRVQQRDVKTGLRQDGRVEIVSGLNPGERYVARIPAGMQNGSLFEAVEGE